MSFTVIHEGRPLTVHDWNEWVDLRYPVTGPAMTWGDNDTEAVHYTAAVDLPDGDLDELGDPPWYLIPPYLRAIQRDYLARRGYSIGYNWAVDWLGGIWRLRGWDIGCAANLDWNHRAFAILLLVDGADPATPEMLRSCRYLHQEGERRANRTVAIRPHSQLGANPERLLPWPGNQTACPGNGARGQMLTPAGVQGGLFNWRSYVPPQQMGEFMRAYTVSVPGVAGKALLQIDMRGYNDGNEETAVERVFEGNISERTLSQAEWNLLVKLATGA